MKKQIVTESDNDSRRLLHNPWIFALLLLAGFAALALIANALTGGDFLTGQNIVTILSHTVYPALVAWGINFLFACGYTDLSVGGVVVLGAFATVVFGNWFGYPGVILGGLIVGTLLVFINFSIFAFSKIPSWIAGISLAMIYEAIGVFLKVGKSTKALITAPLEEELRAFGQLEWSLVLMAAGFAAAYILYNNTTVGLNIRAMGGNKEVARALGINITGTLLLVGVISGIFVGIASVVQVSFNGNMTVKTGLTSMNMLFQPLAIVLLSQILKRRINIIVAIPICSLIIYSIFNLLTHLGAQSGTLQEAFLGAFLIIFGIAGQRGVKGVVK